ncbi:MAG: hypothetical protein GY723_12295 [bacterium]|nr:hypothetical protein [bacterium]
MSCSTPLGDIRKGAIAAAILWGVLWIGAQEAFASDPDRFPNIHGEILFEIQSDWTSRSDERENEINDLYATIEPAISFQIGPQLSLESGLVLEPAFDPQRRDRYFDGQSLFAEQLFLQHESDRWSVRAGKFNPRFGIAWDQAPGIYGIDFAEDYEITERIGLGGALRLGNDRVGFHHLTADVFFLDTSFLSRSVPNDRGLTRKADGGASNTGDPRSFTVTLQGEEIPGLSSLGYHLGISRQQAGRGGRNEQGYAAGLTWGFSPSENIGVDLLSEYVYRRNRHGEPGKSHDFTQSASLSWRSWNLAFSYSTRDLDLPGPDRGGRDHLFQASIGYELEMGLSIDFGWRSAREDGHRSDGLGGLLAYTVAF